MVRTPTAPVLSVYAGTVVMAQRIPACGAAVGDLRRLGVCHPSRRALANVLGVSDRIFRLVCGAAALEGAPEGWARMILSQGEIALLVDDGQLDAINAVAHALGLISIPVLRRETTAEAQEQTVIEHAARMPLVWVADAFGEAVRAWARDRGPMTLLVQSGGALPATDRHRIERFVASLGRQAE